MKSLPRLSQRSQIPTADSVISSQFVLIAAINTLLYPMSAEAANLSSVEAFSIRSQPIESALLEFSRQAQIQVLIPANDIKQMEVPGIVARVPARAALESILKGSGLTYYVSSRSIVVVPAAVDGFVSDSDKKAINDLQVPESGAVSQSSLDAKRLRISSVEPMKGNDHDSENRIAEVIVTAQKREERIQDVPIPVTVLNAQRLADSNQLRVEDYYSSIPGLSLTTSSVNGTAAIAIRGITTGGGSPTAGITVDDIPYGASSILGGGGAVPDLDPSDLQRIEVLRGPQGALYGASSMGGLLKFVTVDPSTEAVTGRIQAEGISIENGSDPGYGLRAAMNLPISSAIAVRASAFSRREPGYFDNVLTGEHGVNLEDAYGGRLSALLRPSDAFSLKVSASVEASKRYGLPVQGVGVGIGDLQQSFLRGTGRRDRNHQVYSAVVKAKVGSFDLTSITGYNINREANSTDFTSSFGAFTQSGDGILFNGFGAPGTIFLGTARTSKFSQELRATTSVGPSIVWLIGAFYTHEYTTSFQDLLAVGSNDSILGDVGTFDFPSKYEEYALFTNLTFNLTDRFDIQLGGRAARNDQVYNETDTGPYAISFEGGGTYVYPRESTQANAFTFLVTPRFRLSPDMMLYARVASGYRPGGPNSAATAIGIPDHFNPDKTVNYEIGFKGGAFEKKISWDASLYYISWENLQLTLLKNGYAYYANAGRAKSEGAEASFQFRPLRGLTMSAWVSWNQAALTQPLPATSTIAEPSGTRLPYSARLSGGFSAEEDIAFANDWGILIGGSLSYIGSREGVFTGAPPPPRPYEPPYAKLDLYVGTQYRDWSFRLYTNNVTNRRGVLNNDYPEIYGITVIQPRTVGISLTRSF